VPNCSQIPNTAQRLQQGRLLHRSN
jgi:hypothetical protein